MNLLVGLTHIFLYAGLYFVSTTNSSPTKATLAAQQYLVDDLPGLKNISELLRPTIFSGHLELHAENATNYYFLKYDKPNNDNNDKLIIWLNGGPGCSSMDGAFMEIGPLRVDPDLNVYYNNGTWLESGSLLFVDQPIGTGFSYGNIYRNELTDISADFMVFLQKYFELFPNDLEKELYLAGESYAGQYIPYFAKYILEDKSTNYKLKAAMIGNGWISAKYTGMSYIPYAIENGVITGKEDYIHSVLKEQEKCQNLVNKLNEASSQAEKNEADNQCDNILIAFLRYYSASNAVCINQYDYRLNDTFPSCGMNWPPDLKFIKPFLGDINNQRKLNVKEDYIERQKSSPLNPNKGSTYWNECNNRVHSALRNENSPSSEELLPDLLSQFPILLFNGDKDIVCNYIGTEEFISELKWNNEKGFSENSHKLDWIYNNSQVGTVQSERNLTYIRVFNTSHMVPFDSPDISRGIFDILTDNILTNLDDENLIETPIYEINSSGSSYMHHLKSKIDGFHFRYVVYVIILVIILYGIYYYNMQLIDNNQLHSILANRKNEHDHDGSTVNERTGRQTSHRKKTVQWADLQQEDSEQHIDDSNVQGDSVANVNNNGAATSRFNLFLETFGLNRNGVGKGQYSDVPQVEDIELDENIPRN